MQKLAIIGYFVDILGSTMIRLVKYSAELVYINYIGSRSGILWLLVKLNKKTYKTAFLGIKSGALDKNQGVKWG